MSAAPPLNPVGTSTGYGSPVSPANSSWLGGLWYQQLSPGSWRGLPFVLDNTPTKTGRRIALHEYPYKDSVWPEDLGKLPRHIQVSAFLVGDDCYTQKKAMIAACEQQGAGTLVHPTLGSMQVYLLSFQTTDRRDRGRYVEVDFEFIDAASTAMAPAATLNTGNMVATAAAALNTASASSLGSTLASLAPIATNIPAAANFAQQAISMVNDPARALSAVSGLPGLFGRYAMGANTTVQPAGTTVQTALNNAIASRQAVIDAAGALTGASEAL